MGLKINDEPKLARSRRSVFCSVSRVEAKKYCKILEVGVKNDTAFILTTTNKKTYLIF